MVPYRAKRPIHKIEYLKIVKLSLKDYIFRSCHFTAKVIFKNSEIKPSYLAQASDLLADTRHERIKELILRKKKINK